MRFRLYGVAVLLAWSGAIIVGQNAAPTDQNPAESEKVTTPEDMDRVMKKAQPAMQATLKAISSGSYADAKTQVAALRQAIADSQQFWVEKRRDDAVKMNIDTIEKIDALQKAVSAEAPERAAAIAALKDVGGSCRTCHQKYRTTDSEENYIIKPGSLDEKAAGGATAATGRPAIGRS